MLIRIPNLDTLRFALTAGLLPDAAAQASHGWPKVIELPGRWTKELAGKLAPLGIEALKSDDAPRTPYHTLLQLIPLEPAPPDAARQTVLFELPITELPKFSAELLRLGNDRQQYCIVDDFAFLKVDDPPFYSMLSVSEPHHRRTAFVQQSPRVWVVLGWRHPLATQIRTQADQDILLGVDNQWRFHFKLEFQDIYNILEFPIAAMPDAVRGSTSVAPIIIALRIVAASDAVAAEYWIMAGDTAVTRFDEFVSHLDERLALQLQFAITDEMPPMVIVRAKPGLKAPPVLALDAEAFAPYWRIPGLLLPVNTRLHPPIRRETVAKLLTRGRDEIVWLAAQSDGSFTPRAIAERAFKPLTEWIDYLVDQDRETITAWVASTVFDYMPVQVAESVIGLGGAPRSATPMLALTPTRPEPAMAVATTVINDQPQVDEFQSEPATSETLLPIDEERLAAQRFQCDLLEREFLAGDGSLDDPRRVRLWPKLSAANAKLGASRRHEAFLCAVNARWYGLAATPIPTGEADGFEAFTVRVLDDNGVDVPAMQSAFETQFDAMPVKAAWMTAMALAAKAGGDLLGLARVRDRLMERMLTQGLTPDLDVPSFLRFAGADSPEARLVRDRMPAFRASVHTWLGSPTNLTRDLADIDFAFSFAVLGEATAAQELMHAVKEGLADQREAPQRVLDWVTQAGRHRISEALAGRPHAGPLPESLRTPATGHDPVKYAVDRLREESRILEPHLRLDPYANTVKNTSTLLSRLAELQELTGTVYVRRYREIFEQGVKPHSLAESRLYLLHDAAAVAPTVGVAFVMEVLDAVPATLVAVAGLQSTVDVAVRPARLAAQALALAAHLERADLLTAILESFIEAITGMTPARRNDQWNALAFDALRSLGRSHVALSRLADHLEREIDSARSGTPREQAARLQLRLAVAAARMTLGQTDDAMPALASAAAALFDMAFEPGMPALASLAAAYLGALGAASAETAFDRVDEFFRCFPAVRVKDQQATAVFYHRFHLTIIEKALLAVAGRESAAGRGRNRWLDEDETLVRRRILTDFEAARRAAEGP